MSGTVDVSPTRPAAVGGAAQPPTPAAAASAAPTPASPETASGRKTRLLPPSTAVRIDWARTGAFSGDEQSKLTAVLVEASLKDLRARAADDPLEKAYVDGAIATMDASLRSLDLVQKNRTINFDENEKLRSSSLDSIKDTLDFGTRSQDFLKSLPTMTIGAAGAVTVAQSLGLSDVMVWALGIGLAATGYFVNLYFVSLARGRSRKLYLTQDYERSMYFEQYVTRVRAILAALYLDVDRIHQAVFGAPYGGAIDEAMIVAGETLTGVGQTYCPLVHEHMHKGVVTPELWPICETGVAHAYKKCPLWKESK